MTNERKSCEVVFHVRRFNPETDEKPYWQQFTVKVEPGMTVLDGLHQIKRQHDFSLAWRYSCRMGVCGSCGMLINGSATLACNTQILDISDRNLTIAALPNFKIIRDLVSDLSPMFEKHVAVLPYMLRDDIQEMHEPTGEYYQSPDDLLEYLQFTYCIKCGCCMAACPTMATDDAFLGPQPLAQAYRYTIDNRDDGTDRRKKAVTVEHGLFRCHYGGECSAVCPKGVDPARAIQLMKKQLFFDFLKLTKHKTPAHVLGRPEGVERNPKIPEPPPYTVEQE
ncbi:succinate dehydrogenase iron-sulfur subunit [bacterium]|nr:succinate dehydrogenase iron-sulfur subunit [candidate division CSSED10-310 bacterium]